VSKIPRVQLWILAWASKVTSTPANRFRFHLKKSLFDAADILIHAYALLVSVRGIRRYRKRAVRDHWAQPRRLLEPHDACSMTVRLDRFTYRVVYEGPPVRFFPVVAHSCRWVVPKRTEPRESRRACVHRAIAPHQVVRGGAKRTRTSTSTSCSSGGISSSRTSTQVHGFSSTSTSC
jgi:hypothetical protein